ncbi:uncharacterized protein KQ657_004883 [Scheffersomyces spartinae]|uniref:Major facilitator superfamily (MFS) profile domain-containing protein n=1 Tax=Scheffersomyces spartinae TaxID=45513 RepID=A0A9P8AIU4_9ASCO|nr:uncharacterized protein KQ657_004883 [Scheffersomyces spartinae]KAG7194174.1 hypothetical protein KQ657_004883 [Scheffersomyces spartinae]
MSLLKELGKSEVEHLEVAEENQRVDNLAASMREGNGTGKRWWNVPYLCFLNWQIFVITLASTNNGYDSSMLNGLQSLPEWHTKMGNPTGSILGALSNGTIFGALIAVIYIPWMADKFGRKFTIIFSQSFAVIGAILQGVSTNYGFFLASRIIIGLGSGAGAVCATLIAELAYPTHREVATTFYNVCWYLGAIIAAWVTYGTRHLHDGGHSWRIPSYMQGLIPLIQAVLMIWAPESPRYYVAKDQVEKARAVLTKYHIGGSTDPKDVAFVEFELNEFAAQIKDDAAHTQNSSYMDFVTDGRFRKRLGLIASICVFTQFSGNGLVSYYLSKVLNSIGITSTTRQLQINGCLMIYNFVISAFVASVVNRFKRRHMFLTSVGLMMLFYIIWTILSALNQKNDFKDKGLANGVLAMIFLYYCAYDIGANGVPYLYVTEILPYSHRVKGLNIMTFLTMVILIFNGFVNPVAMDAIDWKYYIVFCCVNAVMLAVVWFFFVETSGYTLEEVEQVFDASAREKYAHNVVLAHDTDSFSGKGSV